MCTRYTQTKKDIHAVPSVSVFKPDYDLFEKLELQDNNNTSIGQSSVVIARDPSSGAYVFKKAVFGLRPFWAKDKRRHFNARSEGKGADKESLNESDDPNYTGPWLIDSSGAFGKPFKEKRCLLPVGAFFEGPKQIGFDRPYLIQRKDEQPIFMAGCMANFEEEENFTILTTPAAQLLQKVGHHRSPLLIAYDQLESYLDHTIPVSEIKKLIHPFDSSDYKATPLSAKMKKPNASFCNNDPMILEAIGEPIVV